MSAIVVDFYSGRVMGPAMLEHQAAERARLRDVELLRQVDALVEAYRFAWEEPGQFNGDELLQKDKL
jgi:hypothetical protein